jgi:hypothetical protein
VHTGHAPLPCRSRRQSRNVSTCTRPPSRISHPSGQVRDPANLARGAKRSHRTTAAQHVAGHTQTQPSKRLPAPVRLALTQAHYVVLRKQTTPRASSSPRGRVPARQKEPGSSPGLTPAPARSCCLLMPTSERHRPPRYSNARAPGEMTGTPT